MMEIESEINQFCVKLGLFYYMFVANIDHDGVDRVSPSVLPTSRYFISIIMRF